MPLVLFENQSKRARRIPPNASMAPGVLDFGLLENFFWSPRFRNTI